MTPHQHPDAAETARTMAMDPRHEPRRLLDRIKFEFGIRSNWPEWPEKRAWNRIRYATDELMFRAANSRAAEVLANVRHHRGFTSELYAPLLFRWGYYGKGWVALWAPGGTESRWLWPSFERGERWWSFSVRVGVLALHVIGPFELIRRKQR